MNKFFKNRPPREPQIAKELRWKGEIHYQLDTGVIINPSHDRHERHIKNLSPRQFRKLLRARKRGEALPFTK